MAAAEEAVGRTSGSGINVYSVLLHHTKSAQVIITSYYTQQYRYNYTMGRIRQSRMCLFDIINVCSSQLHKIISYNSFVLFCKVQKFLFFPNFYIAHHNFY